MRKRILAFGMAVAFLFTTSMTIYADSAATVKFTKENTLEYSGVTIGDGTVNLGSAFENIAPGEKRSQTITLKNNNSRTADFYMSTEVVKALETNTNTARGAGYEITLTAGETVLYDSTVGGYNTSAAASAAGIADMNEELENYVLVATLKKGESRDVVLSIFFDGEAMDNASGVDYSQTSGQLAFDFQVGYDEPSGETKVIDPTPTKTDVPTSTTTNVQEKVPNRIVQIVEEKVPLAAVATGDDAMIGSAIGVLAVGIVLLALGKKKKGEKEA